MRNRKDIQPYIEEEIVTRYYYQRGRCQQMLRNDHVFDRAVSLLKDEDTYNNILKP